MNDIDQVTDFHAMIDGPLQDFVNASQQLGEPMVNMANMVQRAFNCLLDFLIEGMQIERPNDARFSTMTQLMADTISAIQAFRNANRQIQEIFNHLSTISESIVALSWISVNNTPVQFIRDMRDAGQYYGNRVLLQYKGNHQHQDWVNKWNIVLKALEDYVKRHHLTGFDWNAITRARSQGLRTVEGGDAGVAVRGVQLPPPPPPPPSAVSASGDSSRQNLLRDLNQGVNIVQMLRPVNREQPPSRSPLTIATSSGGSLPRNPTAERTYPPKFLLDGRKWRVEHQKGKHDLVIDSSEMSHSLALFKCVNSVLEVRNKLNGVSIDSCKRTTIVLNDIISSVEVIGCQHVTVKCFGQVPLISVDNSDSVEIFLIEKSFNAEVISSKSTSLNVSLDNGDGDFTELPVPEQIKTVVVNRRLVSTVIEKN